MVTLKEDFTALDAAQKNLETSRSAVENAREQLRSLKLQQEEIPAKIVAQESNLKKLEDTFQKQTAEVAMLKERRANVLANASEGAPAVKPADVTEESLRSWSDAEIMDRLEDTLKKHVNDPQAVGSTTRLIWQSVTNALVNAMAEREQKKPGTLTEAQKKTIDALRKIISNPK